MNANGFVMLHYLLQDDVDEEEDDDDDEDQGKGEDEDEDENGDEEEEETWQVSDSPFPRGRAFLDFRF